MSLSGDISIWAKHFAHLILYCIFQHLGCLDIRLEIASESGYELEQVTSGCFFQYKWCLLLRRRISQGAAQRHQFCVSAAKHNENHLLSKLVDGPISGKSAYPKSHMAVKSNAKLKKISSAITLNEKTQ